MSHVRSQQPRGGYVDNRREVIRKAIEDKAKGEYAPPPDADSRAEYDYLFGLIKDWESEHPQALSHPRGPAES